MSDKLTLALVMSHSHMLDLETVDVVGESAVQIGRDAEVEVLLRAGDCRAEIVVGVPYLDGGGVVAALSWSRHSVGLVGWASLPYRWNG